MGYRSDIYIALTEDGYLQLRDFFNNYLEEKNETVLDFEEINNPKYIEDDRSVFFSFTRCKWQEQHNPRVAAIMQGLETLNPEDYLYIRLGDNENDNDIRGEFFDNVFDLHFVRMVDFRLPSPRQTDEYSAGLEFSI